MTLDTFAFAFIRIHLRSTTLFCLKILVHAGVLPPQPHHQVDYQSESFVYRRHVVVVDRKASCRMSHYPFVLQEMMGLQTAPRPPRTAELTDDLAAEFDLNWGYTENGTSNPVPAEGVATLMGPANSEQAGLDATWPNCAPRAILCAVKILRKSGFTIQVLRDDHQEAEEEEEEDESETAAKRQKMDPQELQESKDPEYRYLVGDDYDYQPFAVHDSKGNTIAELTTNGMDTPWLVVRSTTPAIFETIQAALKFDFSLSKLQHESNEIPFDQAGYKVVVVTGSGESPASVSSKFTLTKGEKEVAKALLSYHNGEMSSVGPTLELLEVAKQWQQHGLGSSLMRAINKFLIDVFAQAMVRNVGSTARIRFCVCYVTNANASSWFQRKHGFQDLDGMGEELGKHLDPDDSFENGDEDQSSEGDY